MFKSIVQSNFCMIRIPEEIVSDNLTVKKSTNFHRVITLEDVVDVSFVPL